MANIYLLRHGKVDGPAALYGHTNVTVTPQENQLIVEKLGQYLQDKNIQIEQVISSPLIRCLLLSEQIAADQNIGQIKQDTALKEMNFGRFDGTPFDDVHQDKDIWSQLEKFWQNPVQHSLPEAELLTGFSYRVVQAWQNILSQVNNDQGDILVVSHGGVIRMILAHLLNIDFRNPNWYTQLAIGYASLTHIKLTESGARVKHIGKPLVEDSDRVYLQSGLKADHKESA